MRTRLFSLLELIVAFALTTLITSACSAIFLDTREVNDSTWYKSQAERQASTLVSAMRKDLEGLCPPNSSFDILHTDSREEGSLRKDSLGFFALRPTSNGPNMVEIEYLSSPGAKDEVGFRLYRRFSTLCDGDLQNGGLYELILNNVTQFKLDYLVKNEWTSMPTQLPQALHVQLSFWVKKLQFQQNAEAYIIMPTIQ